jgi:hypothetical protein
VTIIDALADLDRDDPTDHTVFSRPEQDAGAVNVEPEPEPLPRRRPGNRMECFVTGHEPYPFEVTVLNPDRLRYEKLAVTHKEWPTTSGFVTTVCLWAAARREGKTTLGLEAWEQALEDFEALKDVPSDPTR